MNDREFLNENQLAANNTNPAAGNSYSDLDFSALNMDNYQDSPETYSDPISEGSVNPFSSDVEAPDLVTQPQEEIVDASTDFINQEDAVLSLNFEGVFRSGVDGTLEGTEATGVSRGTFAGDSIANQEEINSLIENVVNDNELEVDHYGTIRNASADSGLRGTGATGISQGDFADVATKEEVEQLLAAVRDNKEEINNLINEIKNVDELEIDNRGIIVNNLSALKKDIRGIIKEIIEDSELMLTDSGNIRLITTIESIEKLAKTVNNTNEEHDISLTSKPIIENIDIELFVEPNFNEPFIGKEAFEPDESSKDVEIDLHGTDATGVATGCFAGDSIANQEEINSLIEDVVNDNIIEVDRYGTIRNASADSGLHGTGATGVSQGDFAAQWYEKKPNLYQSEKKLMKQRFPNAKEIKLSNGNLAWQIKMNISRTDAFDPWTFLLVYMPDHPNNTGYGGSVKVIPLVPNLELLQARVKESKGRYFSVTPPVPHVVRGKDGIRYLCTRASNDIEEGNTTITTAVQVAAWAVEWALYFELSMRDNRVWNKWVDDDHFKTWKISE